MTKFLVPVEAPEVKEVLKLIMGMCLGGDHGADLASLHLTSLHRLLRAGPSQRSFPATLTQIMPRTSGQKPERSLRKLEAKLRMMLMKGRHIQDRIAKVLLQKGLQQNEALHKTNGKRLKRIIQTKNVRKRKSKPFGKNNFSGPQGTGLAQDLDPIAR